MDRCVVHWTRVVRVGRLLFVVGALALTRTALGSAAPDSDWDPVLQLQQRLDTGQAHLSYDNRRGWLDSVLGALHVPVDSQGLVFSKTSKQASLISPQTPRAVYFNDDVYVGWVPGGKIIEIASVHPGKGAVFYSLSQQKTQRPRFVQDSSCAQCHQPEGTDGVPRFLMRSVYPDAQGMPVLPAGTFVTTDQSPMNQRWGGWYVDGKTADPGMGNGIVNDLDRPDHLARIGTKLIEAFDATPYLSPHSDVVALMVLAHQTHLHNLLAQADDQTRTALRYEAAIRQAFHESDAELSQGTQARIKSACDPVVEGMLFSGDPPLASPMQGSTDFVQHFEKLGPRDSQGRSLRDFDLRQRLFKYPCSYLIYSQQFDALPGPAKQYIYRRLWKILTGRDDSPKFNHLTDPDRDAIYQIIGQTKKGLPAYWKPAD